MRPRRRRRRRPSQRANSLCNYNENDRGMFSKPVALLLLLLLLAVVFNLNANQMVAEVERRLWTWQRVLRNEKCSVIGSYNTCLKLTFECDLISSSCYRIFAQLPENILYWLGDKEASCVRCRIRLSYSILWSSRMWRCRRCSLRCSFRYGCMLAVRLASRASRTSFTELNW